MPSVSRAFRRRAAAVLGGFVVALVTTLAAPWMQADAHESCAMEMAADPQDDHDADAPPSTLPPSDHAAHCPLCLPVSAPPALRSPVVDGTQHGDAVYAITPAPARVFDPVSPPLPARGPPLVS